MLAPQPAEPPSAAALQDRVRGCLLGLAIGDALGYPHEFRSVAQVRAELGPAGVTGFLSIDDPRFTRPAFVGPRHPPGTFTDDTQMSLAVAEALLSAWSSDDELFEAMGRTFVRWARSPENNRSPGATCMAGCRAFERGVPWRSAGVPGSKGCGANMRVAPIALYFNDPDRVVHVAREQSYLTHGHPTAVESSGATALGVHLSLMGLPPREVLVHLRARWPAVDELGDMLAETEAALSEPPERVLVDRRRGPPALGEGWVAEEALASALYCAIREPDDAAAALLLAANTDGDSDSIASITGALIGARLGLGALPPEWVRDVERSADLLEVADQLYAHRRPS